MTFDGDDDDQLGSNTLVTDLSGDGLDNFDFGEGDGVDDGTSLEDMASGTDGGQVDDGDGSPISGQSDGDNPPPANQQLADGQQQQQQSTPPQQQQEIPPQGGSQQQEQTQQPVDFVQYVRDNAETIVQQMADNQFKLSAEEAEVMGDAAPVVARYMARSHLITMVQMTQALNKALPQAVGNLMKVSQQGSSLEQQFFTQYPELKNVDQGQLTTLAIALRQANKGLKADQFFPLLARTAAAYAGVQLPPVRGKSRPHTPAAGGGQRGQSHNPVGQRRTVATDALQGLNLALRDSE